LLILLVNFVFLQKNVRSVADIYLQFYLSFPGVSPPLLLSFFLVLGQYQVQDYSEDEYHGDAVFGEDGLDNLRENFEHLRCGCES
jgi:hypothetical protein